MLAVTRAVLVTLIGLVLLLLVASSLPVTSVAAIGPIEAALCLDDSGGAPAPAIDMCFDPPSRPALGAAARSRRSGALPLMPKAHPQTQGVLRL